MAWYFLDRNVEEGRGDQRCLYWRDQAYTYREVQARANRCGQALRGLGLGVEDRVLIILPDRPEFAFAWFGAAKIGAVIAMVNPLLPAEEYLHYFEYTRAKVADRRVRDPGQPGPAARALHPSAPPARGRRAGAPPLASMTPAPAPATVSSTRTRTATTPPSGSSRAGSTGQAQGGRAPAAGPALEHRGLREAGRSGIRADDLTVSVPKLFFGYATGTNLLFPFAVGGATAPLQRAQRAPRRCSTRSSATGPRSSRSCRP